ncbi:hypothetical protein [Moritella viscosa]|uniref:hypothetical protein n=1 Tax=Moritella viscosa TaxID=80854 RepID=UPI00094DB0DD|nr:hypothetical protein [Moritella viscosa]
MVYKESYLGMDVLLDNRNTNLHWLNLVRKVLTRIHTIFPPEHEWRCATWTLKTKSYAKGHRLDFNTVEFKSSTGARFTATKEYNEYLNTYSSDITYKDTSIA